MNEPDEITAYILCGGRSSRLGSDKALVKLNGITAAEIILNELKKVFSKIVLVAANCNKYSFLGIECINDVYFNCGPLAGIHSALKHSRTEKVFVISCDMPLIKSETIKLISGFKSENEIIIPKSGGRKHYLCALYNKSALEKAEEILEETKDFEKAASPYDLINICGYDIIDFDSIAGQQPHQFENLNTPEDLERIQALLY